jgi:hypothetical protein
MLFRTFDANHSDATVRMPVAEATDEFKKENPVDAQDARS